jgi:hypothetical protein
MDYADAGNSPYTAAQVVTNAYSIIFNTGLFPKACHKWRCLPAATATLAKIKSNFAEAHQDLRLAEGTLQEGGYHSAHNAMDSFVNKTANAFANLATATASDQQMLADLTAINRGLPSNLLPKTLNLRYSATIASQTTTRPTTHHPPGPTTVTPMDVLFVLR